ncbi:hypothetical protein [Streptomyces sp. NPDC004658]|uniref:hypothetical protein n=1 Tax=Streptomyces sp. NPDC004658 TaxID=3154672 RepID=UPI0033A290D3
MFVDTTGRRSKVLRRLGLFLGAVCLAYAGVLAAAFMGWGTSLTPSSLLPFDAEGGPVPGRIRPEGGAGRQADLPHTTQPTASPTASATTSPTESATTSASAGAN